MSYRLCRLSFIAPFVVFSCLGVIAVHVLAGFLYGNYGSKIPFVGVENLALLTAVIVGLGLLGGGTGFTLYWLVRLGGALLFKGRQAGRHLEKQFAALGAAIWSILFGGLLWAEHLSGFDPVRLVVAPLSYAINALETLSHKFGELPDKPVPTESEIVMGPGTRIVAKTQEGTIEIVAGRGLKRSYTWEGATRSVEMWPRAKRWYGSLGIYFPGPGEHWKEHNGITRACVEEGQQHFETTDAAMRWLKNRTWLPHVYRDDGVVVGWGKCLGRKQLNVDVWQIYVNGVKPTALPGSHNDQIVMH